MMFTYFITTSRRFKCVPQILGSLSIHNYIHPTVLAHCRLLAEDASISEERKRFDVGETFSLCFKFAA